MRITNDLIKERVYGLALEVLKEINPPMTMDGLRLSALGARICYSSEHPIDTFLDRRVQDKEEMIAFLSRLAKAGHYSIFAHSPVVYFDFYNDAEALKHLYKCFYYYDLGYEVYCLNFRHFAELFPFSEAIKLIREEALKGYVRPKVIWAQLNEATFTIESVMEVVGWEGVAELAESISRSPGFLAFALEELPWCWYSFILHGVSRNMTHQLVRHTYLNFSQRSHRYTEVDGWVVPPAIRDKYLKVNGQFLPMVTLFNDTAMNSYQAYRVMVDHGVRKEDARYITPSGATTTIMASGPYFVWEDFVEKRLHKKAQWEIRVFAEFVKHVIT